MKTWINENLGFKIVALVVALVLWFGVKTERSTEVLYPVPLEIVTESDQETIVAGVPEAVDVRFSGTGKDLLRLGDQNYRVRKVLPAGRTGPRRVLLDPKDVADGGNLNVTAVAVEPNVLTLNVDRITQKRVPLRPLGPIEPARGYELEGPVRFEPPSVTLIGARTVLSRIDTLTVDLSDLDGSRGDVRTSLSLRIPQYPGVIVQPDSVRVLAAVHETGPEPAAATQERS